MIKPVKIVLTGGPCSGKSSALSYVQSYFSEIGYDVILIPEIATDLILCGFTPMRYGAADFEAVIAKIQLAKENALENVEFKNKTLIVCDRGFMDAKAYTTESQFNDILDAVRLTEIEARDRYDAVFHLVTAAIGAEEFYTKSNNEARIEDVEEAIESDKKTLNAWNGHQYLRVIDNESCFESKVDELIRQISFFLSK